MTTQQLLQKVRESNEQKQYRAVIELLDKGDLAQHNNAYLYAEKAQAHWRLEEYALSEKMADMALIIDKNCAKAHHYKGNAYSDRQQYEDAIAAYKTAIDIDPKYSAPHTGLGIVYNALKRYEEAIDVYKEAIDLDPEDAYPHNGLGNVYDKLKRYEEAIATYKAAIDIDQKYAAPHYGLGIVYKALKRYEDVIAAFKAAIDIDPHFAAPHNGLGIVYAELKRYEDSIAAYKEAIDIDQKDAYPHNGLGIVYKSLKRYEDAIAAYKAAIDLDPEDAYPHNGLGNVYDKLNRYEDAIAAYKEAIDLNPEDAYPHNGLGNVYDKLKRYEEAIATYKAAIDIDQKYAAPHYGLGIVYAELKRYEDSIAAYKEAIDIDQKDAYPHNGLGNVYYDLKRYEEAIDAYRAAIDIDPHFAHPYYHLYTLAEYNTENEINGLPNLYKFISLNNEEVISYYLSKLIDSCIKEELPLLLYHIFQNDEDLSLPIGASPGLLEAIRTGNPFFLQFKFWAAERQDGEQTLLAEAIMNYYLGNPMQAYEIFIDELEGKGEDENYILPIIGQYYLSLTARVLIDEERNSILNFACKEATQVLTDPITDTEQKYYAGLIYLLAGREQEALAVFQALPKYFAPARYQVAALTNEAINKVAAWHRGEAFYKNPGVTLLDNEQTLIKDLQPLLHIMECRDIIERANGADEAANKLYGGNPLHQPYFFARHIQFAFRLDLSEAEIKEQYPKEYARIMGRRTSEEIIEEYISHYIKLNNLGEGTIVHQFTSKIEKDASTDFSRIKKREFESIELFEYQRYKRMGKIMVERGMISIEQREQIQQYTAQQLLSILHIEAKSPKSKEIVLFLLTKTFDPLSVATDILSMFDTLFPKKEIISYKTFCKRMGYKTED